MPDGTAERPRVFVAHSHELSDKAVVDALANSLTRGLQLDDRSIRITSRAQNALASGSNVTQALAEELAAAEVFLALITPSFLAKPWCLCELGAAWNRHANAERTPKAFLLFAVPPLTKDELGGVLEHLEVLDLDGPGLDRAHNEIRRALSPGCPETDALSWSDAKMALLMAAKDAGERRAPAGPLGPLKPSGIVLSNQLVDDDGLLLGLSVDTAEGLVALAELASPYDDRAFKWERARQFALMFEVEAGRPAAHVEALRVVLAVGTVGGDGSKKIVTQCVSTPAKELDAYPTILTVSGGKWKARTRKELGKPERFPESGQRPRDVGLVSKTWRWSLNGLRLGPSEQVRMVEVTHYPTAFFPRRDTSTAEDFWMLGLHRSVSGRTAYRFAARDPIHWLESLYRVRSPGLEPIVREPFSARILESHARGADPAQEDDLAFIREHLDRSSLPPHANEQLTDFLELGGDPWDHTLGFWIDPNLDEDLANEQLVVFAQLRDR